MSNYHELVGIAKALGDIDRTLGHTPQELAALHREVTWLREGLADIATAVRELNATVAAARRPEPAERERRRWALFCRPTNGQAR